MLLTFEKYCELGGIIENELIYNRHACRAESIVNAMTHGRIANTSSTAPVVQYAMVALVEAIYAECASGADGRQIASVSNDGVSVSYVTGANGSGSTTRYAEIVRQYLQYETDDNGTPLLYAGVDA